MTFADFDLDPKLLSALEKQRFHTPTPVQQAAIPELLMRKDVLAGAATGTGKTAAFILPVLQYLLDEPRMARNPRALILAPTRELAFQIHKVLKQLGTHCDFSSQVITGGFSNTKQQERLKDAPVILVATPGRLLYLLGEEHLDLSDIELLIIDEADRMLDMGQGPDVKALIETIPRDFQAACFSATLAGAGITQFAEQILEEPEIIQIDAPNQQSSNVQHQIFYADDRTHKLALLQAVIEDPGCQSALVFCNKKEKVIELNEWFQTINTPSVALYGDMVQARRLEITKRFTSGKAKVMVATDVAARGLDMLNITHVINYDMPLRGDIYIHRIGRTGRGNQVGVAISLVEAHDYKHLERIEYHLQNKLPVSRIEGMEPKTKVGKTQKPKKKPHKKKLAKKAAKSKAAKAKKNK